MPRVTISEPGKTPQPYRFKLKREEINIGRGSDNDIIIKCGSASTHHCTMNRIEGGYILRDTGSTNGIKLDDTLMSTIDLFDGMEILIGDVPMKFQLSDDEIATLSEENFTSHQKKKLPPVDDAGNQLRRRPSTSSPRASHSHQSQPTVQKSGGTVKTISLLALMLIAIFGGMTLRHLKETGNFLPTTLMGGDKARPEKSAPSGLEADSPVDSPEKAAE